MQVQSIAELSALLALLQEHGVTSYEASGLRLELSAPAAAPDFADEGWSKLRERHELDEQAIALAHVEPIGIR